MHFYVCSLLITSLDHQLATSLLATCYRLVVNKLSQAMRTHPDIGLLQDVSTEKSNNALKAKYSNKRVCQKLNISKDVKPLFFARSLGFPMIRHFHAPRCPRKKQKQATLIEFQYKSIGKTLLQARKLAFLWKLPNRWALLVKKF